MMAAGMQPMATMPHNRHVARFSPAVLRGLTGLSLWKYSVSTAKMAPIWITTKNSAKNSGDTCSWTKSSTMIIWPVEEMGSHSVTPSTMPRSRDFNASMIINCLPLAFARRHGSRRGGASSCALSEFGILRAQRRASRAKQVVSP